MSENFGFTSAIEESLRVGQERLATKDRINEILKTFADDLQKILSDDSKQEIFVQKRHIVIRKKLSKLAAIAVIGLEDPPIEEEYDAICLFDKSTYDNPFVVFRYEIDPVMGFPCRIQYDSSSLSCKEEETLTSTIIEAVKYKGLAISEKIRELENNSNQQEKK